MGDTANLPTNGRWFGVVRKKDGTLLIASKALQAAATQSEFLTKVMGIEPGDTVLDLFFNARLEFRHYQEYCHDAFKGPLKKPVRPA